MRECDAWAGGEGRDGMHGEGSGMWEGGIMYTVANLPSDEEAHHPEIHNIQYGLSPPQYDLRLPTVELVMATNV